MDQASAQAAAGMSVEDAKALEVLQLLWADEYSIGYDGEGRCYWAARNGVIGHILIAASVEELSKKIDEDFRPATS
jgi:hypothetical protein